MDLVIIAVAIALSILIWGLLSGRLWSEVFSGMFNGSLGGGFIAFLFGLLAGWLVPALDEDNSPALWSFVVVGALVGMWFRVKRVKRVKGVVKPSRASSPSTSSRPTQISSHPLPDFSPQTPGTPGWSQQQAYNKQIEDDRIKRNIAARGGVDDEGYPLG